ncbi:hypothetical protein phi2LM21_p67 [Sinorhizobium phage phi2LM21]|nr:hypothetical protein phi2LM21_p67 [Sinorhizobium phage phi2LM21]OWZ95161.1 hypothetical protein B9J07_06080 [Sinorhizobium sp. LM21]
MTDLSFDNLIQLYQRTEFGASGEDQMLTIDSQQVVDLLLLIEQNEKAAEAAQITILAETSELAIGKTVAVEVAPPQVSLGALARDFDNLLQYPKAHLEEPPNYFVIEGKLYKKMSPSADIQLRYRQCLQVVALLCECASYVDATHEDLVFLIDNKMLIPVYYTADDLQKMEFGVCSKLAELFKDEIHRDQKLSILGESAVRLTKGQNPSQRFRYLLQNLDLVIEDVRQGYQLFASSFSYGKIKDEIEAAKGEFVSKIHKTVVDIQGQLLGLPVATVVVASQLKASPGCGPEHWTNIAVLGGAWVFFLLLTVALVNQWFTLASIKGEVDRQKSKLNKDYASIGDKFADTFQSLGTRICWHRAALIGIFLIAVAGVSFATIVYRTLTTSPTWACLG